MTGTPAPLFLGVRHGIHQDEQGNRFARIHASLSTRKAESSSATNPREPPLSSGFITTATPAIRTAFPSVNTAGLQTKTPITQFWKSDFVLVLFEVRTTQIRDRISGLPVTGFSDAPDERTANRLRQKPGANSHRQCSIDDCRT